MDKIKCYKTEDGQVFETEQLAKAHEETIKFKDYLEREYYTHIVTYASDLFDFITEHKTAIMEYLNCQKD